MKNAKKAKIKKKKPKKIKKGKKAYKLIKINNFTIGKLSKRFYFINIPYFINFIKILANKIIFLLKLSLNI